jgi:ketosteroid isomerase-like protein
MKFMATKSWSWRVTYGLLLAALLGSGCQTSSSRSRDTETAVRDILNRQVSEWNAGNLAGFMQGYAKSDGTRFASGGDITLGWQTVFDRYQKKYGTDSGMGVLDFSGVEITPLGSNAAMVFGRWHLKRDTNDFSGLFTLLFRQTADGWRIVHDHTSSSAK